MIILTVADADSSLQDALIKMIGFLQEDEKWVVYMLGIG